MKVPDIRLRARVEVPNIRDGAEHVLPGLACALEKALGVQGQNCSQSARDSLGMNVESGADGCIHQFIYRNPLPPVGHQALASGMIQ